MKKMNDVCFPFLTNGAFRGRPEEGQKEPKEGKWALKLGTDGMCLRVVVVLGLEVGLHFVKEVVGGQ